MVHANVMAIALGAIVMAPTAAADPISETASTSATFEVQAGPDLAAATASAWLQLDADSVRGLAAAARGMAVLPVRGGGEPEVLVAAATATAPAGAALAEDAGPTQRLEVALNDTVSFGLRYAYVNRESLKVATAQKGLVEDGYNSHNVLVRARWTF